jgi:adenylate kinase
MAMRHVVIMGPQGSGKGTQAELIAPAYGLVHLATGDIFRALMEQDNELSREVRGFVDNGELVPDDLTVRVLLDKLDDEPAEHAYAGALLDGFPRNRPQLDVLDQVIAARGEDLAAVVHLAVPRDVLEARIELRARDDDNPEALRRRLAIYYADTEPLLDVWRPRGIVLDINGDQTIDAVTAEIERGLATRGFDRKA